VTSTAKATVVIVNYNGAHLLPACLDGVAAQAASGASGPAPAAGPDFDTIVVDNASEDGSVELLRRDYPWVRVIANTENLGFAGGNNAALREVRTPYAVLLNNDAIPQPGWLANLLAGFAEPGNEDVGIITGKVLFLPKFVELELRTEGFVPGSSDTRELGARIYSVTVDGADVTEKVMWEQAVYGPEGVGADRFRWSRPAGTILVPIPMPAASGGSAASGAELSAAVTVRFSIEANEAKPFTVAGQTGSQTIEVTPRRTDLELRLEPGTPAVDVVNNAGGQVFEDGSGGDRGFQQIDHGQYDAPGEVFTACGNGMAMRTAVGANLGWFDDGFFMYYEDTDLSWRWRAAGWTIRYEPSAVLRHIHAASSKEWSPFWVFHVERNRLLMLTKNATAGLAGAALRSYLRASSVETLRAVKAVAHGRRPPLRDLQVRARVLRSYLTHVPSALRYRTARRRKAIVPASELQHWLVKR
jgi:GT2 family glycosyltransferase